MTVGQTRTRLGGSLLLLALVACAKHEPPPPRAAAPRPRGSLARGTPTPLPLILTVPPGEMPAAMRASYRLHPDARFLNAIVEVRRLLSPKEPMRRVDAVFEDGKWHVRDGERELGTLPELPGFSECLALVTSAAAKALGPRSRASLPGATGDPFLAPDAIRRLNDLDTSVGKESISPETAREAARMLTRIAFETVDHLDLADVLSTRALATLAIARAARIPNLARDEALLALACGYSRYAETVAKDLPADDPIRLLLDGNLASLEALARKPGASAESRFLWLKCVAKRGDLELWNDTRRRLFGEGEALPIVEAGLDLDIPVQVEVETRQDEIAEAVLANIEADPQKRTDASKSVGSTGVESFVVTGCREPLGRLWDFEACAAFYRSPYYSALNLPLARELEHARSDPATILRPLRPAPEISAFGKTFNEVGRLLNGDRRAQLGFLRDPMHTESVGGVISDMLTSRFLAATGSDNPDSSEAIRCLVRALDTRPSHRQLLVTHVKWALYDLRAAEALFRSLQADIGASEPIRVAATATFLGDWETVVKLLAAPSTTADDTIHLLSRWDHSHKSDVSLVEAKWDAALERFPHDWGVASVYVDFLREQENFKKACLILEEWLSRNGPGTVGYYHAHVRESTNYALAGQYQKCLDILSPVNGLTRQRCEAKCLNGLGRKDEAERLAKEVFEKYPSFIDNAQIYVEILWENSKYDEAARILVGEPARLSESSWWWEIGPSFARIFHGRPKADVVAALQALRKGHASPSALWGVADAFVRRGDFQQAFDAFSEISTAGTMNDDMLIEMYQNLKRAQGAEPALAWLRNLVPPERRNPLSVKAFYTRSYELLWTFIDVPKPENEQVVWLMRAAAVAIEPSTRDRHLVDVRKYFDRADGDVYFRIGRYLVGLETLDEMMVVASTPSLRCAAAFYAGVKAEGEGRYEAASDWYRVAVETNQMHEMGRHMSFRTLRRWSDTGKTLKGIADARL